MRIKLEVEQHQLGEIIQQLRDQMGYYSASVEEGGVHVLIGEKFNVYVFPCRTAILPETIRRIEILPKGTQL